MAGSHGAGIRTAALGAVGAATLIAGVLTGHGTHDGFLLAAAGGFALGIAAALAIADARAEGRTEAERAIAEEVRRARADDDRPAEPAYARTSGREAFAPGSGAAAVARATVAAVAHDMSNPLASLKSNLEWLRDALEAGRLDADQAEAREVLRDAREAAERLRVDVGQLRAAGRGETPPAQPS
jgi:signal transduction histidine kinase